MERIAVSISHEREYAVAVAFGIRTQGGEFVFPIDMEARMDDREKQLMARMRQLRDLHEQVQAAEAEAEARADEGAEATPDEGAEATPDEGAERASG
jgi:hypothetical protein